MIRKISKTRFAFVCFSLLGVCFSLPAHAEGCSPSQVTGKWAAWTHGNVNGVGPRVSAAIFTLDTAGNVSNGKATSSLHGTVIPETFSGTYSVNPDCTGELVLNIFDTSSGKELFTATIAIYFDDGDKNSGGSIRPPCRPTTEHLS